MLHDRDRTGPEPVAEQRVGPVAHFFFGLQVSEHTMAALLDKIRATADRVAASHGLDVVDVEFSGGSKHRALRVFLEKNAEGRAAIAAAAQHADSTGHVEPGEPVSGLPRGIPVEHLSGLTHEDCAVFSTDFGTLIDVEDLIPGGEYTLEVSSPGLERRLLTPAEWTRFTGSLVKLQTFTPVNSNRHFTGRLTGFDGETITLDLAAAKPKGKKQKAASASLASTVAIGLANVEKANLVAEI